MDTSHPGPLNVPGVSLSLKLDSLSELISAESGAPIDAPDANQPQVRSQSLQSESLRLSADSQTAKFFPTLQISAALTQTLPDVPNPPTYLQKSVGVSLSLPLYLGDPTRHLVDQQKNEAMAAEFRAKQLTEDILRDFSKAQEMLQSLKVQRSLAARDVAQSREESKLYYTSYKAGKINFIDVQNANVQALQAKVNAARIDAQILNQLITLKYLSGKEIPHG
jgi:outer membrane protein TolC